MDTPILSEMRVGSLAKIEGQEYVVINPSLGAVSTIDEPTIEFLAPSASVTHWGEANRVERGFIAKDGVMGAISYGNHITWKPFSAIGSSTPVGGA